MFTSPGGHTSVTSIEWSPLSWKVVPSTLIRKTDSLRVLFRFSLISSTISSDLNSKDDEICKLPSSKVTHETSWKSQTDIKPLLFGEFFLSNVHVLDCDHEIKQHQNFRIRNFIIDKFYDLVNWNYCQVLLAQKAWRCIIIRMGSTFKYEELQFTPRGDTYPDIYQVTSSVVTFWWK